MSKLLTISIPTWNRAKLLEELLNSLCNDLKKYSLENKIQILVSNNASDDNTEEVVVKYSTQFDFIVYNKNAANIGAKSNVLKSMELASTPFVIFFGDDDRVNVSKFNYVIETLETKNDVGVLLDTSRSKFQFSKEIKRIKPEELVEKFYWYMGNAGLFIVKTDFIKNHLAKFGYDFFNECWPQTQLMLLGLTENKNNLTYCGNFNISADSVHGDVMVYSSFYLWRTVVYDLRMSIEAIKSNIPIEVYNAALENMKKSLKQNCLNLLQCGIFVDDKVTKKKTIQHINQNIYLFHGIEKSAYLMIASILMLPPFVSKTLSNVFIFLIRGSKGLKKKNDFANGELSKKRNQQKNKEAIRALEFEK